METKRWTRLEDEWLKVNVDTFFINGRATIVLVAKNSGGKVLLPKLGQDWCKTSLHVEVRPFEWAMTYAVDCQWVKVEWNSYAFNLVQEVQSIDNLAR